MRRLYSLVFSVFVALFSTGAQAAFPPVEQWTVCFECGYHSTLAAACGSYLVKYPQLSPSGSSGTTCYYQQNGEYWGSTSAGKVLRCPEKSKLVNGECVCDAGTVESGSACIDPNDPTYCRGKLGTSEIVNITAGWKRTPKVNAFDEEWVHTYRLPPSGTAKVCSGGVDVCQMSIDASEPCSECGSYVSQVPAANGMYRVSIDFRGRYTGEACSANSSSDLPPEATNRNDSTDPPCPGYVGEVNGVRGCYGTASKPVNSQPPAPKPSGIGEGDAGNPAAGNKPPSGEGSGSGGSGRTPSTGTGGSAGGPAGSAAGSGTKPDGTTPSPDDGKEQANCGAPGQPKCRMDEGGTPSKFDGDKAALDKWKSDMDANRTTIKDADGGFFDSYNVFFAAPPFVPCEAIELPNDVLLTRQCDVVDGTRSVMAYIWALAALWICLGWIREAI